MLRIRIVCPASLWQLGVGMMSLVLIALVLSASSAAAAPGELRTGVIAYQPAEDEAAIGERFRLAAHEFPFQQRALETSATKMEMFEVTFPSPVETPHPENNTVHCEYYRPATAPSETPPRYPATVVLHILGGDFDLSRLFCRTLAHHGVAALFVKLPYYGPRRPAGRPQRMISTDPRESVTGMTQAILDLRRARAWLAAQPEIDPLQTGIFGISLGGITAALAGANEPRFTKVCPMLAGGDIGQVSWRSKELAPIREKWEAEGGDEASFCACLRPIDPMTYAANLRGRPMLFLNAAQDEVVPPECTRALWRGCGEPEIVWFDAGHYTALRHIFDGLGRVVRFFQP